MECPGLRAFELSVALFAAVLAELVLVVSEGTVERRELTELVSLVVVLAFRYGSSLPRRCNGRQYSQSTPLS
jgi:hypothetical protein